MLGKYKNGICYKYANGSIAKGPVMLSDEFRDEMSVKLARFHSVQIEQTVKFKTQLERVQKLMGPLIGAMALMVEDTIDQIDEPPYKDFPKLTELVENSRLVLSKLNEIGLNESEIVFRYDCLPERTAFRNCLYIVKFTMLMSSSLPQSQ